MKTYLVLPGDSGNADAFSFLKILCFQNEIFSKYNCIFLGKKRIYMEILKKL